MKSVKFEYYEYSKKSKSKIWLHKAFKEIDIFWMLMKVSKDMKRKAVKNGSIQETLLSQALQLCLLRLEYSIPNRSRSFFCQWKDFQNFRELLRLHSPCTIFWKHLNARAEIRHTTPLQHLQCSDCKILVWGFLYEGLRAYKRLCKVNAA